MPGQLSVAFEYLANLDVYKVEKPYNISDCSFDALSGSEQTNIKTVWHHNVPVEDVRGRELQLSFDKEGFEYLQHDTPLGTRFQEDLVNDDLKEMTEVVRKKCGAQKAICYDIRVRLDTETRMSDS
jgi:hypothetical protein